MVDGKEVLLWKRGAQSELCYGLSKALILTQKGWKFFTVKTFFKRKGGSPTVLGFWFYILKKEPKRRKITNIIALVGARSCDLSWDGTVSNHWSMRSLLLRSRQYKLIYKTQIF